MIPVDERDPCKPDIFEATYEPAETVPAHHETPDVTELRRLAEAATPGPWRTEYLMGAGNDLLTAIVAGRATPDDLRVIGSTLAERDGKFIAAAVNALPGLLGKADALLDAADRLAQMTEARNNARAEVKRLTAKLDAIEADGDKLSIMSGWLVYDVGEHTCGGYGPESGYAHEPGCGFEPVLRLDKLEGWPGEKPLDGRADS